MIYLFTRIIPTTTKVIARKSFILGFLFCSLKKKANIKAKIIVTGFTYELVVTE